MLILDLSIDFLDCFVSLGLTQWASESTFVSSGSVLDLFFTTEENGVGAVKIAAPFPRCLHSPVIAEYLFSTSGIGE